MRTVEQQQEDARRQRERRRLGLVIRTAEQKARDRQRKKIRYWARRQKTRPDKPKHWHPPHRCTGCDQVGHNVRSCKQRQAAA